MLIEYICREIISVLDSHLSELSGAVKYSLHVFAEKMFEKGFISECVMNNPESFKKIVTEFKANFCFIQKLEDLESKLNIFLNIFRDLGGPLKTAAERMEEEIKKAIDLEIQRQSRLLQHSKSSKVEAISVRNMGDDSVYVGHPLPSGLFYSNPSISIAPSSSNADLTDNEVVQSFGVTMTANDRHCYDSEDVAQSEDRMGAVVSSLFTTTGNESRLGLDLKNPIVHGNRNHKAGTPVKDSPATLEQPFVQPSQQESGNDEIQVTKKMPLKSASQEIGVHNSGTSFVPYYKTNSCPGCFELNSLKKKEQDNLKKELQELKQKLEKLEEEKSIEREKERERYQLRIHSQEEKFKNWKSELKERQKRLEVNEHRLVEDRHKLQKEIELRKSEQSNREVVYEMRMKELSNQETRMDKKIKDFAQKKADFISSELRVTELKLRLDNKESELKEQERNIRERRLEQIDYCEKERNSLQERSEEVTNKWSLYWRENELFRAREKMVWTMEVKLEEQQRSLENKEKHVVYLSCIILLLTLASIFFFLANLGVYYF